VGNGGVIGHTTDGGAGWATQTNPDIQNRSLYGVFFLDSDKGWAVGIGGVILHTTNGGTNWTVEGSGLTSKALAGVHFTSPTNGYIVGNSKILLKYGEITFVEDEKETPTEFSLSQNYPNPFNPSTKIKYRIPTSTPLLKGEIPIYRDGGFITLKVYDVLGNKVETLVYDELPAGEYEVEFINDELTSGVYFYQLKAGNFIQTKKMVLIKYYLIILQVDYV